MTWLGDMIGSSLGGIMKGADEIIETFVGDEGEREKMKGQMRAMIRTQEHQLKMQAGNIVKAEAKSEHWLTANWRPLTMMVFVFIIANNYIIAPYAEAIFGVSVSLELPQVMWELLKIGLGGYVVGRSAEKGIRAYGESVGKKKDSGS